MRRGTRCWSVGPTVGRRNRANCGQSLRSLRHVTICSTFSPERLLLSDDCAFEIGSEIRIESLRTNGAGAEGAREQRHQKDPRKSHKSNAGDKQPYDFHLPTPYTNTAANIHPVIALGPSSSVSLAVRVWRVPISPAAPTAALGDRYAVRAPHAPGAGHCAGAGP